VRRGEKRKNLWADKRYVSNSKCRSTTWNQRGGREGHRRGSSEAMSGRSATVGSTRSAATGCPTQCSCKSLCLHGRGSHNHLTTVLGPP